MARAQVNGIEIEYQIEGTGPPLLLVMGLGGQLTDWHPGLVDQLAETFTVIRYDNRDIGLSTYSDAPAPSRWDLIRGNLRPASIRPAYTLDDMADDANELLKSLDIASADVVGMSMGGMLAQLLALRHPDRVRSLCSIMSNTGDRRAGRPAPRVLWSLAKRGQPKRDQAVDMTIDLFRQVAGPDWSEAEQRRRTSLSLARSYNPAGVLRQSQAIAAASDRTERLGRLAATDRDYSWTRRPARATVGWHRHRESDPTLTPHSVSPYGTRPASNPGMNDIVSAVRENAQRQVVEANGRQGV